MVSHREFEARNIASPRKTTVVSPLEEDLKINKSCRCGNNTFSLCVRRVRCGSRRGPLGERGFLQKNVPFQMFLPSLCLSLKGPRNGPLSESLAWLLISQYAPCAGTHTHGYLRMCVFTLFTLNAKTRVCLSSSEAYA